MVSGYQGDIDLFRLVQGIKEASISSEEPSKRSCSRKKRENYFIISKRVKIQLQFKLDIINQNVEESEEIIKDDSMINNS